MKSTVLHKQTAKFSETQIDDEFVVMVLDSGDFFSLAGTAGSIWGLIDGSRSRDAIVAALAEAYQVLAADIAGDVDDFLGALCDAKLIVEA